MASARRAIRYLALAALLGTLDAAGLSAFTMEPIVATLAPLGAKGIATFRFRNDGSEPVAIMVRVATRATLADGTERNGPADDLFDLYPSRLVIGAGDSAVVKLRWKGPARLSEELPFRLIAEQVPVDFGSSGGSGLRILFRYIASVYVGEEGFKPSLSASATATVSESGQAGFLVEVANRGRGHVVPEGLAVELASGGEAVLRLGGEALGGLAGANYLPGSSRSAFVPSEAAVPGRAYDARIAYDDSAE